MIMNNNLFKTLLIPAAACLLGACAESADLDMETGGESGAIRFAGPAVTRAAIDGTADMQTEGSSFSVWGNYTDEEGSTPTSVFTAETVTYVSGMWGYEGTRYWLPGNTYDFYAWYPRYSVISSAAASVEASAGTGISKITGFDATKGHDLMAATESGIETVEGRTPEAVSFSFEHLLTRLTFNVKAVGRGVMVTSFKVNGMIYKGDLTCEPSGETSWSNPVKTTSDDNLLTATDISIVAGETYDMLGDMLLLPHTDLTGAGITVNYHFEGETVDRSATVTLSDGTAKQWDAGSRYAYTLTVSSVSLGINVTVLDWDEQNTSVSWQ